MAFFALFFVIFCFFGSTYILDMFLVLFRCKRYGMVPYIPQLVSVVPLLTVTTVVRVLLRNGCLPSRRFSLPVVVSTG